MDVWVWKGRRVTVGTALTHVLAFALTASILATRGYAQDASVESGLTERDAITRALSRAGLSELIEGSAAAEEGRARSASVYPNPELNYAREQTFGSSGSTEDYFSLSQTIDLGGRRSLRGEAGDIRAQAVRREGESTRLDVASDVRTRFYNVLHRQLRVRSLDSWLGHVTNVLEAVRKREARGDVASYDRRRLEREQNLAKARLAAERAAHERARARLQSLTGGGVVANLVGVLMPPSDPEALSELRATTRSRPDILALDAQLRALDVEQRAATRWWAPELKLEGGWKGVSLPGNVRTDGFILGAGLTLPLWDRNRGVARTTEGEAHAARGTRRLLESELEGELIGARSEAVQLRAAASEFRHELSSVSPDLVRMATLGYEGGEQGILELLDAYRGAADDELTALDLEYDARRSRIELDRLTGARLP
jgi:outer membrane protein, heavy metal efflux system